MRRTLLGHGAVLGAAMGALALALEILRDWPHAEEAALALEWLPTYAGTGALLGLLAAPLAVFASHAAARERAPGILLMGSWLGLGCAATLLLPALMVRAEFPSLARCALALGAGASAHLLGLAAAGSSRAWLFASAFAPFSASALLLGLTALAGLGAWTLPTDQDLEDDPAPLGPESSRAPNLILVVLDGVRADRLGCYGHYRVTSPRLDALADESVLFPHAFAASSESEAALRGVLGGAAPLAQALRAEGWQTWTCFDAPLTADSTAGAAEAWPGFERRVNAVLPQLPARLALARLLDAWSRRIAPPAERRPADWVVDRALELTAQRDPERPFFLCVRLADAAPPHLPPPEQRLRFLPEGLAAEDLGPERLEQSADRLARAETGSEPVSLRESAALGALYDAEILAQDGALGRLLDGLIDAGLMERSLLVVVGTHGLRLGEEGGRLGHSGALHDAALRVPLLLRLPELLPAGERPEDFVGVAEWTDLARALLLEAEEADAGPRLLRLARGERDGRPASSAVLHDGAPATLLRRGSEAILLDEAGVPRAAGDLRSDPDARFLRAPAPFTAEERALWQRRRDEWRSGSLPASGRGDGLVPLGGSGDGGGSGGGGY